MGRPTGIRIRNEVINIVKNENLDVINIKDIASIINNSNDKIESRYRRRINGVTPNQVASILRLHGYKRVGVNQYQKDD